MVSEQEAAPSANLPSYYARALNTIAHAIATHENTWHLLQETCQSTGQVLKADRVVIYDLSFHKDKLDGLHEWLNPDKNSIEQSIGNYPLALFREGAEALWQKRGHLSSHANAVHPALLKDSSAQILHEQMHIQSLLWFPFAFRKDGFYLLVLNQVFARRDWQQKEIDFLNSVSTLVTIALNKIRLMAEREALLASVQDHNRELSRLNEAMTHHFQEPVRRLATYSQQLQLSPLLREDQASKLAVDFIHTQAFRLSELVRAAQGYLAVDQEDYNLKAICNSEEAFKKALTDTDIEQQASIEVRSALPWVIMDNSALEKLFSLLLHNACHYQHPSRPLQVEIAVSLTENTATFYLADNGSGIPAQYRESVFELFTRLVSNKQPGSGMGLALARKLLSKYQGRIYIEDGLEGGSCLVFSLPLATQKPETAWPLNSNNNALR
ncbi:ATP-binding protein [Marinospirillum sp.]|uniref:sensor histidine kinase n=1 Tax=Marinospirillum sp. TaxID=2183934 RepID=UPI0038508538